MRDDLKKVRIVSGRKREPVERFAKIENTLHDILLAIRSSYIAILFRKCHLATDWYVLCSALSHIREIQLCVCLTSDADIIRHIRFNLKAKVEMNIIDIHRPAIPISTISQD